MNKVYSSTLTILLALFTFSNSLAQSITNKGKDFWVGYGHHQFMEPAADNSQQMVLYLATGDSASIVTVRIEGSGNTVGGPWTRVYSMPANTVVSIEDPLPPGVTVTRSPSCITAIGPIPKGGPNDCGFDARLISPPPPVGTGAEGVFSKKGIHITSTTPISAYSHIYGSASSGATMLLPVNSWGYNYTSINSAQIDANNAFSWLFVMADSNNTKVEIIPGAPTRSGKPPGVPFVVTLNRGDIYQVVGAMTSSTSGHQLTGTTVRSIDNGTGTIHRIAVFSGSSRTAGESPCDNNGRDNDMQQAFPLETWGKRFLTAPTSNSSSPSSLMTNVYKVAVSNPATVVKRNGVVLTNILQGKYYKFTSNTADYIEANRPIAVAQFMGGGSPCATGLGDPEMIYLSPVEQAIKKTTFYRNTQENISFNYVTTVVPTSGMLSLKIDGTPYPIIPSAEKFSYPHPAMPGYTVAVKRWAAAKAMATVECDSSFTGVTYGLGSVESYGYNIGANFDSINPISRQEYNTIIGSLYLDNNNNAIKDSSETFFKHATTVTITPANDTISTMSSNGQFHMFIDTGNYVTKVMTKAPYYTIVPSTRNTSFATFGNTDTLSFAVQPAPGKRDLSVHIMPLGPARPGFNVAYKIIYENVGTDTANGEIAFVRNPRLNYNSASLTPTNIVADTITWSYSNLIPSQTGSIIVYLTVPAPPATAIGDTISSAVSISSDETDLNELDNLSVLNQRVVGSYDPNDKRENHGGSIKATDVADGEYMQYTIRFQNTGTDTAFNVTIRDTLDDKLIWSSLTMIGSSHNFQLTMLDGKRCVWDFKNINLVDSNTNEPLSHGYLTFIIKPKANLGVGDIIKNTAAIYFDANLPVFTNQEQTMIVSEVLPVKLISFTAKRDGKKNLLEWQVARAINFKYFEVERSANGHEFSSIGTVMFNKEHYQFVDNKPLKANNYYRLKLVDRDGKFEYSNIKQVDNTAALSASIYPNPAKEKLQLLIQSDKSEIVQLQVIAMDGKILVQQQVPVQEGATLKSINVSQLQRGSYLLQITTSEKKTILLKFEKV